MMMNKLHTAVLALLALQLRLLPCRADGGNQKSFGEKLHHAIHSASPHSIYKQHQESSHHTEHASIFSEAQLKTLVSDYPYINPQPGSDDIFYTKIAILGTQVCWEDVASPIPWMELEAGGSHYMHSAFPHWSVNTGKCLGVAPDQQGTQKPTLVVVECASSNQVLIFDQLADDGGTIRLLTDPDKCLSTGTTGVLEFRACDEGTSDFFIKTDHRDGHKISLKGDHHKCISALDRNNYEIGAQFDMKQCEGNATPLGFMETKEHLKMDLVLRPRVVDFQYTSLGETFMGNPGVQLQWDAKYMVMYPWQDDHCDDGCSQPKHKHCDLNSCVVPCNFVDPSFDKVCDGAKIDGKRLERQDAKRYQKNQKSVNNKQKLQGKSEKKSSKKNSKKSKGGNGDGTQAGDVCNVNTKEDVIHKAREDSERRAGYSNAASNSLERSNNEYNQGVHTPDKNREIHYLGFNTTYDIANKDIRSTQGHDNSGKNLGLGKDCTGLCKDTSVEEPCSCGTSMSPGCQFQEGYDCMSNTEFLPASTIFVGCNKNEAKCTPQKSIGTYLPLLIPSGLDIRTCPDNVLDGQRVWGGGIDEIESTNTAQCEMNDMCENERFVGTMSLSGVNYTFCCPGEKSDPFSPLSYGFYGVYPPNGHFQPPSPGHAAGVECNAKGCVYRPVCGCPTAIPALNIKVSGPGRVFDTLFVPAKDAYSVKEASEKADIVIAPILVGNSTLRVYTVFKGSDDSFTAGDYVVFNTALVDSFIDKCGKDANCNERGKCSDVGIEWYQTNTDPFALKTRESISGLQRSMKLSFNKYKEWNVRKSPTSIFDNRRIILAPYIKNGDLWTGPVFVGHPGKTYVGKDPDLQGIFASVFGRPETGPGSAPGGTTSVALERFKAYMQCKLSVYSGTEKDPRIVY